MRRLSKASRACPQSCPRASRSGVSSALSQLSKFSVQCVQPGRCRDVKACAAGCPSAAEVSRTITALVTYGTLSTLCEDGTPLGTYITYVLDKDGLPLLRLRKDAVHTANLLRNPRCTLFAHPAEKPARELARVTLVGTVEPVSDEESFEASARHAIVYGSYAGVDAPQRDDLFMRLRISECFYVAGLGHGAAMYNCYYVALIVASPRIWQAAKAERISCEDYCAAEPDHLKDCASRLVQSYNSDRVEDVLRIAASQIGVPFESMHTAEFIWIDKRGLYLRGESMEGLSRSARYEFNREALNELDVVSMITMASQVAWEQERNYTPSMPEAVEPKS